MNESFTPSNYLRLLSRHWLLIVIPLIVALIVAVIISVITPVQYTSTATLLAPNPQLVWRWENNVYDVVDLRFDWRAEIIPLIDTEAVAQRALDQVQGELSEPMDAATLVASTDVRIGDGSLFYISVNANQPEDAALLANAVAAALPETVADFYAGDGSLYQQAFDEAKASYDMVEENLQQFRSDTGLGLSFSGDIAATDGNEVYGAMSEMKQELVLKNSRLAALQTDLDRLDFVLEAAEKDPDQVKTALLNIPSLGYYDLSFDKVQTLAETDPTVLVAVLTTAREDMAENIDGLFEGILVLQADYAEKTRSLENLHRSRRIWAETIDALDRKKIELDMKRIIEGARVQVIDPAQAPQEPSQPNWPMNLGIAFAVGLLGGLLLAIAATYLSTSDS